MPVEGPFVLLNCNNTGVLLKTKRNFHWLDHSSWNWHCLMMRVLVHEASRFGVCSHLIGRAFGWALLTTCVKCQDAAFVDMQRMCVLNRRFYAYDCIQLRTCLSVEGSRVF